MIIFKVRKFAGSLLFFLVIILGLFSCEDNDIMDLGFDRKPLLASVADNLIIPNFVSLQTSIDNLFQTGEAFVQTSNEANLDLLRSAWIQAATDHQHCSAFGFGPAALLLGTYTEVLGTFPVDEQQVEQNMLNANFDLLNSFDRDVRGFYAVEYLIYGNGISDADLIVGFDQNRKDYLMLLLNELKVTTDNVVDEWNDSYRQSFINSDGTAAGSSISLYYNEFVKDYENLKNFKLELPAGLTAGQGSADGSLVEAFYSGISRGLIIEHFESLKNIWLGISRNGTEIIGFEAYLETVVGGPELITTTKDLIAQIELAIASLPQGRLSDRVADQEIRTLRDLLQDNTANFKSSMSSLLGISITFNSGDGD